MMTPAPPAPPGSGPSLPPGETIIRRDERLRGLLYIAGSALGFAVMNVLLKLLLRDHGLPPGELVVARSLLGLLILYPLLKLRGIPLLYSNPVLLTLRGVFGGVAIVCFVFALQLTTLTKASFLSYAYPIFATVITWLVLKEGVTRTGIAALAVAIGGVALMMRPGRLGTFRAGDWLALVSALFSGAAITTLRRVRSAESTSVVVLHFAFWCTLIGLPAMFVTVADGSLRFGASHLTLPGGAAGWTCLLGVGGLGIGCQMLLTNAYRYVRTSEGSTMSLLNAVFGAVLGVLILGDRLEPMEWAGGAVTLAGCALLLLSKR